MGWALIRGWALINFFCLWDGRLFEVGANSRLGPYSNKYGTQSVQPGQFWGVLCQTAKALTRDSVIQHIERL